MTQKLVPNLERNRYVTFSQHVRFWEIEKIFFSYQKMFLHQTIIQEWLMFSWKILTPTFILTPFLLNLRKISDPTFILTSTFIRHLRVCKMISLGIFLFFHFSKIWFFWAKNGVKEQQWPKIGKKLVCTLPEEQHVIYDCDFKYVCDF